MRKKILYVFCMIATLSILVACTANSHEIQGNIFSVSIDVDTEVDAEWCDCGESLIADVIKTASPLNIIPFSCRTFDLDGDNTYFVYEFIELFENLHEVTFHHWDSGWNPLTVIWTDTAVRDLSLVALRLNNTDIGMQPYFTTRETLLTIDEFLPGEAIIANLLFAHYLIPSVGLIFTDENGVQRRMFIAEDLGRSAPCFCFGRFVFAPYDEIPYWATFKYYEWH